MRNSFHVVLLPGDGIGPEVVDAARTVMDVASKRFGIELSYEERKIGGAAIREEGEPVSEETLEKARTSDAVLLGAVGHPDFDRGSLRPEAGLLKLRKALGAFANLRPVEAIPALLPASPLKEEVVKGVDVLIVRELTGGIYFGEKAESEERASDLSVYTRQEVERVARVAFEAADGSAPDIAGSGEANPYAAILSAAMLFRHALGRPDVPRATQQGVSVALEAGFKTPDIGGNKSTGEVTRAVSRWTAAGEGAA